MAAFQPLYPNITQSRLTTNCVGRLKVEVRTAGSEKWLQLPVPNANPSTRKATSTISLVDGEDVLHLGRAADAEAVQRGERRDQERRHQLARAEPERKVAGADHHRRVRLFEAGKK